MQYLLGFEGTTGTELALVGAAEAEHAPDVLLRLCAKRSLDEEEAM
jgi:hypothetical protein